MGCQDKPANPASEAGDSAAKGPEQTNRLTDRGGQSLPADGEGQRKESARRLKELAQAMLHYNQAHGKLPPAVYLRPGTLPQFPGLVLPGDDIPRFEAKFLKGKPLPVFSWRVELLPFLGQKERDLYKEFRFNEPWDSPHNKKLLARMPEIYAPVWGKTRQPYATYYQVFATTGSVTDLGTPFNGMLSSRLPASFPDGTMFTFLIVEAGEAVPWTKPEDIPYAAKKPVPKLGGLFPDGFHAAFADASVRFIPKDTDEKTLRLLIVPNDGQPVVLPGKEVKVDVKRPRADKTEPTPR
jgi:hypothetical protein